MNFLKLRQQKLVDCSILKCIESKSDISVDMIEPLKEEIHSGFDRID